MEKGLLQQSGPQTGVMLIGHGTRDETGTKQFFELGRLLAEQLAPTPVIPSLLEFQKPTIPEAWEKLVGLGVTHVQVAPLLLFAAGHAKQDIPQLLAECQSRTPHINYQQSGPLSRHASIIDLVCERIEETCARAGLADCENTALVMVGRGSHDPCAQADMRVLTEIVGRRCRFALTTTAFYAMAEPRLPSVLDEIASIEKVTNIIVQPHLLFEGRLFQAICRQVNEATSRHPGVVFHTANFLGPVVQVAKAIKTRLECVFASRTFH